jgi:asparagine synthase (glutamine-hydrolysing)
MLVKVDRMSMSNSLETRVPFLDFRLIEFLVSVHKNIKMEGLQRKSILRNTIGKQLPKALLRAPKKGFVVPLDHWFTQNMFKPRIADMCQELNLLFNKDALMKICSKTSQGKNDHSNLLWSLFVLKGVMKN